MKIEQMIASIAVALCVSLGCMANGATVEETLAGFRDIYPEARYPDIYKSFMQDYFGPGHILADTAASGRYLRRELAETDRFDGPDYEPTGNRGMFYRVNLSVIRDGRVPYDRYFSAFVRSVSDIVPPEVDEWRAYWMEIDSVVMKSGLDYPELKADRDSVLSQLAAGDPVVHHTEHFNRTYSVHYRIISREIFERELLPLL